MRRIVCGLLGFSLLIFPWRHNLFGQSPVSNPNQKNGANALRTKGTGESGKKTHATMTPPGPDEPFQYSDKNAGIILGGKWYGKLDKKELVLTLDVVQGGNVAGYNMVGKNKRPVKGTYGFFRSGGACKLILKEPGNARFDGEFKIEMDVYEDNWAGAGTWRSYDGKLSRSVKVGRKPY